jgi:5S rRNA maturation endonuclease (ribonuclease M5)
MTDIAYHRVIDALRDHGSHVIENGHGKAQAQCPAHDDGRPSLSITAIDGQVLIHCHAGCPNEAVVEKLNLAVADLFDTRNGADYHYPDGRVVHRKLNKTFPQSGNRKGRALFHEDRIGDATIVYIVEGEKDVLAIEAVGGVAVCSAMGAGKAHLADWSPLKDKDAVIIADKDGPGYPHAHKVAELLDGAKSVVIKQAKTGKDAADHIAAGHGLNELIDAQEPSLLDQRGHNGTWLNDQQFADLEYAVDKLIPEGLGLLVGPPKKGKSFLVANIGLAVAGGGIALGAIPVTARPVLYLALEDGYRRLQSRFLRILNEGPIPAGIDVVIKASPNEALLMIGEYLSRHAGRKPLIIVDTLGKIKPAKRPGEDAYLVDYQIGSTLKTLADAVPGSTLLLVHHTRKAETIDFVDSISGTQGLAGSVDFVLVLNRKRHANDATLSVTGRDVPEGEYALMADDGILWRLDGADLATAHDTVEQRRALEKMGDRMMDVFLFVHNSNDPVTATAVATALDDMDGATAGTYLRRLAANDYITRVGRGQYLYLTSVSEVSVCTEQKKTAGQGTR